MGLRLDHTLYVEHSDCAERKWQGHHGSTAIEDLSVELAQWLKLRLREAYAKARADLRALLEPS